MAKNNNQKFQGKRVIVTGGTTGIGRATARALAEQGAQIFICGRNAVHLEDALESMASASGMVSGVAVDLAQAEGIEKLFKGADEWLGGLDIVILNAALGLSGKLTDMDPRECREAISVNVAGYIGCAYEAMMRMKEAGGRILMIGSMSAEVAEEESAVYVATKSAIRGFAKSLRKEAGSLGIHIGLIEPGSVGTDMVDPSPQEQEELETKLEMLAAEDIAEGVLFALSRPDRLDIVQMQMRPHLQKI